ncbi:unnamed protein product, partial [Ectocarpus sp. 13 AM-2016]
MSIRTCSPLQQRRAPRMKYTRLFRNHGHRAPATQQCVDHRTRKTVNIKPNGTLTTEPSPASHRPLPTQLPHLTTNDRLTTGQSLRGGGHTTAKSPPTSRRFILPSIPQHRSSRKGQPYTHLS